MVNISHNIFPNFSIPDPIGIASSHLTGNERAIKAILNQQPSFLTIKSTSQRFGGIGRGNRKFRNLNNIGLPNSFYSYGPYELELIDGKRTLELVQYVKSIDPQVALGVSVLSSEDLPFYIDMIRNWQFDYLEINLKYVNREFAEDYYIDPVSTTQKFFTYIQEKITYCVKNLEKPILIKISRGMPWVISKKFVDIISTIDHKNNLGFIVANSQRYLVPLDTIDLLELINSKIDTSTLYGAISGNILFPETLTMIKELRRFTNKPIIASGGIITGANVVMAMLLGANAVQICSAINVRGINAVTLIRSEIEDIVHRLGKRSLVDIL